MHTSSDYSIPSVEEYTCHNPSILVRFQTCNAGTPQRHHHPLRPYHWVRSLAAKDVVESPQTHHLRSPAELLVLPTVCQ